MRSKLVIALIVMSTIFLSGYKFGVDATECDQYIQVKGNELSDVKSIPLTPPDLSGIQD